jgi:hypothetical protein
MKMTERKAQFYILMAAIIATVLTGLIAIVNYAIVKPEPVQFYDLTNQLENEVNRVIDYGTYTGKDVAAYVEDFVKYFLAYAQEKDPDLGLIYIYGNSSYLVVANYGKNDSGVFTDVNKTVLTGGSAQAVSTVKMDIGGTQIGKKIIEQQKMFVNIRQTFGPSKTVVVNISDKMYNFDLRGQQYFFAIVESTKDNETYYSIVS